MNNKKIINKSLIENVKRFRIEQRYTIGLLAKEISVARVTLEKKLNGERCFTVENLNELARVFNCTVDELLK